MLEKAQLQSFLQDQEANLNFKALEKIGGLKGLLAGLETDALAGLPSDNATLLDRKAKFGENIFPTLKIKTWFELFMESFEDSTILILIGSAFLSLAIGLYEQRAGSWIEGSAILAAVLIVAVVTSTNNYFKEKQFQKLNAAKDDISIPTIRNGNVQHVNIKDLVVGDIVKLNAGDRIPADGVMIEGSDVCCNESSLTGETDDKPKGVPGNEDSEDSFLYSGTTLSSGVCVMVICAVGVESKWGKIKARLSHESADTPLQEKLSDLADQIGYFGMGAAVLTFGAMMFVWWYYPKSEPESVVDAALKAFIMAVTIVVVAVPEGLPLAVTLSLAFSSKKMMQDNNLIRSLAACETMGNATNICSDKTGTLTMNKMTVVDSWIAGKFHMGVPFGSEVNEKVKTLISEGLSVNSTANLVRNEDSTVTVLGSKTEGALLSMVEEKFGGDYRKLRSAGFKTSRGDRLFTFSSSRKCMSVLQKLPSGVRVFCKGAGETILAKCNRVLYADGSVRTLSDADRTEIFECILNMGRRSLRVIGLAHNDINTSGGDLENDEVLENGLIFDALFGIKDPLRPDVPEAVKICQNAGIVVRMVTGDNIETAKAIATECGILTEGGVAIEGPEFRKLTPAALDSLLPRLQVLARSSPLDKFTLVSRLNGYDLPTNAEEWSAAHPQLSFEQDRDNVLPGYKDEWEKSRPEGGEVVGVTGDGTNDAPALKAADVGLAMGLSGTEVAKDASDIIILDDNFASIVKAVLWGRSVFDNIRKFLQFQLTVNIVALTFTFVSAITGHAPPLNAVMMLWVNMIMDSLGALALGTEPPSLDLLQRLPYKRNASLISRVMWRNIIIQSLFQIAILGYTLTNGHEHFGVTKGSIEHYTVVFNLFVFLQIFNQFNARSIGNDFDVFKGLFRNRIFLSIVVFTCASQYFLVTYGGSFVKTTPLTQDQWVKTVSLGSLSLTLGGIMRLFPIPENQSDFAQPATAQARNKQGGQSTKSNGLSLIVWLILVSSLPAVAILQFFPQWLGQFK